MIACIFHKGSGLGDQLFRYITCRTLALDKGLEFGVICPENFKGKDFMQLDMGDSMSIGVKLEVPTGKVIPLNTTYKMYEEITNYYDPEINFIEDNTIIDGNFQDERYWGHRLRPKHDWDFEHPENFINDWLKVEPLYMPDDLCVVNFRGGEYATVPDLFLPFDYWGNALLQVKDKYILFGSEQDWPKMKFEVHTDDVELAETFFDGMKITREIGLNWRSVRYAKHLILSNSAFGILPALLNENVKEVIAPRYWARRNIKQWSMPQNYYKKFTYI